MSSWRHDYRALVGTGMLALLLAAPAGADTVESRCEIYPRGQDHTNHLVDCVFSQRQGFVTIRRDDGVVHELEPLGDAPGNFRDQQGNTVYRQSGLGGAGVIFRFPGESIYVYWGPRREPESDNPANPYTTAVYDATTLIRCRSERDEARTQRCPAGILRMEDGASIVITAPCGQELTINFLPGVINSGFGPVESKRADNNDGWIVSVSGAGVFEVPQAAIDGG